MRGRDYATPADVKEMALLVLPHRLVVQPESQLRGLTAASIVQQLLDTVPLDLSDVSEAG